MLFWQSLDVHGIISVYEVSDYCTCMVILFCFWMTINMAKQTSSSSLCSVTASAFGTTRAATNCQIYKHPVYIHNTCTVRKASWRATCFLFSFNHISSWKCPPLICSEFQNSSFVKKLINRYIYILFSYKIKMIAICICFTL